MTTKFLTHGEGVLALRANQQVPLGNYAYLFTSMFPTTDYAVIAHSAQVVGRVFFPPRNCTINYYSRPGDSYLMPNGPIQEYRRLQTDRETPDNTRRYGHQANDVVLGKILGRHWTNDPEAAGGAQPYAALRNEMFTNAQINMANWYPHVVTVRNRKWPHMNNEIWLSALTQEIIRVCSGTVNIHLFGCLGLEEQNRWRSGKQAFQTPTLPDL
jgi:hypothetical protein